MRPRLVAGALALAMTASLGAAGADTGAAPAPDRSVEPVVLTGSQFPGWSAGSEVSFREPGPPTSYDTSDIQGEWPEELRSDCYDEQSPEREKGDHSCTQSSRIDQDTAAVLPGAPVDRLRALRWNGSAFEEIPFQVDERFTRYLSNNASGFAFYSNIDQHETYVFDREGFRFTDHDPADPCKPRPRQDPKNSKKRPATTRDPIRGLDDNDELAFMWSDAGDRAPVGAGLPSWAAEAHEVVVADPADPTNTAFAYVVLAKPHAPAPSYTPYVSYERDTGPNRLGADLFVFSESNYDAYGKAPAGPYCDLASGLPVTNADGTLKTGQRRPLDTAWVKTPRYHFRYGADPGYPSSPKWGPPAGRWLMTQIRVSPDDSGLSSSPNLGPDLIDQWKARAFQQRPGGETPCCGYEEEVANWGGSSILLGERVGPVRAIRETWGADSATNNVRREIFYRDVIEWGDDLRVHPIPPLDGIYSQWDFNAVAVDTYYNPQRPDGVAIDGKNDEVFGNIYAKVAMDEVGVSTEDDMPVVGPQSHSQPLGLGPSNCRIFGETSFCNDIDVFDPTMSAANAALQWEQVGGPNGSIVSRFRLRKVTLGGGVQSVLAMPYYRDDSCFDDGTGLNPGPHVNLRSVDTVSPHNTWVDPVDGQTKPRECWDPSHGDPAAAPNPRRFWQGSIGTQGVHLMFVAESDNASTTVPLTEIDSEQRMVVLPGDPGNVGERYGRHIEYPLRTAVRPYAGL